MSRKVKHLLMCASLVFYCCMAFPLHAQDSDLANQQNIGIAEISTGDNAQVKAVALQVITTIQRTLGMIDRYTIHQIPSFDPALGPPTGQSAEMDFIVFGSIGEQGRTITMDFGVYSLEDQAVVQNYSDSIQSVFELFDAADFAVLELLGAFIGQDIAFGTLEIITSGINDSYYLVVDGQEIGSDIEYTDVLAGMRNVQIFQQGLRGRYLVHEGRYRIHENRVVSIEVKLKPEPPENMFELLLRPGLLFFEDAVAISTHTGVRMRVGSFRFGLSAIFQQSLEAVAPLRNIGAQLETAYVISPIDNLRITPILAVGLLLQSMQDESIAMDYSDTALLTVGGLEIDYSLMKKLHIGLSTAWQHSFATMVLGSPYVSLFLGWEW